jgi:Predicted transcriptional regulator, consists of a Zn-ribbon and ATP-cone domains
MHCPFCRHADTQVVDSRVSEDGATIRRRRRCPACDKRFTTYERVELALPSVVKKDGSRTEFDRRKIVASMQLALRKRPVAADAIDAASPASSINCSAAASARCAASASANS